MANNGGNTLKIFLPHQCLFQMSGVLLGFHQSSTIVITALTSQSQNKDHLDSLRQLCPGIQIVGEWDNEVVVPAEKVCEIPYDELLFSLRNVDSEPPLCVLLHHGRHLYGDNDPMIVLYNPDNITDSQYLIAKELPATIDEETNLQCVVKSVALHRRSFSHKSNLSINSFVPLENRGDRFIEGLEKKGYKFFALLLNLIYWLFSSILFNNVVSNFILSLPAIIIQLKHRFSDLQRCVHSKGLRRSNILLRHVIDVALGVSLMYVFVANDGTTQLATWLMTWAHNVASQLQELLEWLMGVPAGLKLNSQLDKFLGKFFIYHIYLWTGYLSFLGPVLSCALWFVSLFGCLGLSAQLALTQDLLSMMTLHIYCFYVYAARLYSLQFFALSSLWRLFRGKKWNVLRRRVDSARYDVDQLFIGTLLFTVLLFLLPTTLLYYVVFTSLRLVVLTLQGLIGQLIVLVNSLPVYALLLRLLHPETLASEPRFKVSPRNPARPLYLTLELHPPCLGELLRYDINVSDSAPSKYSARTFWNRLLVGQLVYPWMDPDNA